VAAEANKAALRRIVDEIINGGDLDAIDELVHPEYVDGYGGPSGRGGYRVLVATMRSAFPDLRMTIDDLVAEGDLVCGRFTIRATHTGDFMGMAPTGRAIELPAMGMIRFRDGQMLERWNVSDVHGLLEQLGRAG
jgi:predicted ester cyclase